MSESQSKTESVRAMSTASIKTRSSLENSMNIDMIGRISHQITGAKLPSNRQVLQVFFYNKKIVKLETRESVRLAIDAALIFWNQARIPTRFHARCVDKLVSMHKQWTLIRKTNPEKRSQAQKTVAAEFIDSLDDLFDIAADDALEIMRIEEDKQFLIMQRQKGRHGCMAGVDMKLFGREKRATKRKDAQEQRRRNYEASSSQQFGN